MSATAGTVVGPEPDEHAEDLSASQQPLDGPTPEEIQEPVLENLDRAITGVITAVPRAAAAPRRVAVVEP